MLQKVNINILLLFLTIITHWEVEAGTSRIHVTAREYYCYLMQMRRGEFNVFFCGGRLFQQWIADMYIKTESMRLDWYSKPANQKIIRADLYPVLLYLYILIKVLKIVDSHVLVYVAG